MGVTLHTHSTINSSLHTNTHDSSSTSSVLRPTDQSTPTDNVRYPDTSEKIYNIRFHREGKNSLSAPNIKQPKALDRVPDRGPSKSFLNILT